MQGFSFPLTVDNIILSKEFVITSNLAVNIIEKCVLQVFYMISISLILSNVPNTLICMCEKLDGHS